MAYYNQSASPPPLQHPVPTHPAYIPEPPSTPASPQGYQRYASSPQPPHSQPSGPGYPQPSAIPAGATMSRAPVPPAGSYSAYGVQGHMAQQQQQQSHGHIPAATPDFSAWGLNDATAQFGMQLGQNAVAAGQDYVQKNLGGWVPISAVKQHFNVSNSYVIKKLQVVVFPWRHKPWSRKVTRLENGQSEWAVPREDINSPDLYIPLMALVTYILLAALYSGLNSRFHPEILGVTASKALAVVLLDFLFVKGGCYFLNIQGTTQVLDLIAYDGYKFVGVIVTIIAGMLNFGRTLYSLVFLYSFFATAFFLLRSLRSLILPDAAATAAPVNTSHRSRRITFLFLVAVSQIVYMGLLVRV